MFKFITTNVIYCKSEFSQILISLRILLIPNFELNYFLAKSSTFLSVFTNFKLLRSLLAPFFILSVSIPKT